MNFKKLFLIGLGAYACISTSLILLPIALTDWRASLRSKFPYSITVVAHRGGSLRGPENTICAFRKALEEAHADMLELDVHQSKDGKVVVCHDGALARVCGPNAGDVSDLTVGPNPDETLPQLLREIPIDFKTEKNHTFKADSSIPVNSETRICLLTEVFERFKGVPLHIDIKEEGYAFVKQVFDLLEEYGREEITFVGSSNSGNKKHIRRYFSLCSKEKRLRYRVFGDTADYWKTHFLYRTGLLPFMKIDFDVLSIPVHIGAMLKDCEREYGKASAQYVVPWVTSPTLWKYLQTRGVAIIGWVFNEEEDFKTVLQFPLNGLITDDPLTLHNLVLKDDNCLVTL